MAPTLADLRAARERIAGVASVTPVFASETFTRIIGREVRLKAENLQRTGSFKIRGAVNKIATLTDAERAAGVVHGTTIAEGIAVKKPGELTTAILREKLDEIVTVSDEEISEAMVLLAERAKLVVEGAGAAALAALVAGRVGGGSGTAVALLSGGNIDPTL